MRGIHSNRAVAFLAAAFALAACNENAPFDPDASDGASGDNVTLDDVASSKLGPSQVFKVPEESPGPPYYSISANGGFIPNDGEWAAFPFLRELGCVPANQDLFAFPAFPLSITFACQLTVQGHEHWQNGPGIDPAPRQTQFKGLGAVPIVFALLSEVQAASAGGLEFSELLALPSAIVGTAHFYKETNILGISGPHGPGKGSYKISARGTLEDSRSFRLHVNEVLGELRVVQIEFGS